MPYNETTPFISLYATEVAACAIFLVGILGTFGNLVVAVFTSRLKTMKNAYGRLTASQSLAEAVICAVFAFYVAPMMVSESRWMQDFSSQIGFINLICYDICIWSHLFIALNRLVAIAFPIKYDSVFSKRNTTICIGLAWTTAIVTIVVLFKMFPCDIFFSPQILAFVFTQSEICHLITWYIDGWKDISIVCIIAVVDCIAIYQVHKTAKTVPETIGCNDRRRREVNFLRQAVLQGGFFVVELFTYFILAWKFESRWITWSLTSLAWVTVHTADGFIIILSNKEFRKVFANPLGTLKKQVHSSNANSSHDGNQHPPAIIHTYER